MFLACVACRSSSVALDLARRRFIRGLTILGGTIGRLSLIRLVCAAGFGAVTLLSLLATDLIPGNALHRSFLELIEAGGVVESSDNPTPKRAIDAIESGGASIESLIQSILY